MFGFGNKLKNIASAVAAAVNASANDTREDPAKVISHKDGTSLQIIIPTTQAIGGKKQQAVAEALSSAFQKYERNTFHYHNSGAKDSISTAINVTVTGSAVPELIEYLKEKKVKIIGTGNSIEPEEKAKPATKDKPAADGNKAAPSLPEKLLDKVPQPVLERTSEWKVGLNSKKKPILTGILPLSGNPQERGTREMSGLLVLLKKACEQAQGEPCLVVPIPKSHDVQVLITDEVAEKLVAELREREIEVLDKQPSTPIKTTPAPAADVTGNGKPKGSILAEFLKNNRQHYHVQSGTNPATKEKAVVVSMKNPRFTEPFAKAMESTHITVKRRDAKPEEGKPARFEITDAASVDTFLKAATQKEIG